MKETYAYFKDWNSRIYLDNLVEFIRYKNLNMDQNGFSSIIYTLSYFHSTYETLLKEIGVDAK